MSWFGGTCIITSVIAGLCCIALGIRYWYIERRLQNLGEQLASIKIELERLQALTDEDKEWLYKNYGGI